MNTFLSKLVEFIARREKLYFRTITVLTIVFLFLAAQRFQDLVLFVSIGLLFGALYYRRAGELVEIGAFIGSGMGFLAYLVYFLISTAIGG